MIWTMVGFVVTLSALLYIERNNARTLHWG